MSGPERIFGPVAVRLAGVAGWHLGWSPDRFWRATPQEMETVVKTMLRGIEPGDGDVPPSRDEIARLQEMFPDG
ncbi:MAG: phage tail assembly chaperone [Sphingobium sp.]